MATAHSPSGFKMFIYHNYADQHIIAVAEHRIGFWSRQAYIDLRFRMMATFNHSHSAFLDGQSFERMGLK
jgi:hypothetical protein